MKLVNIETACTQLGFYPPKGLKPDVRLSLCINYLNQFNLTKVEIPIEFINLHTKKVNPFCINAEEIEHILNTRNNNNNDK